jgi:hypothetical protein
MSNRDLGRATSANSDASPRPFAHLPEEVAHVLTHAPIISEYASVTGRGVPINTPLVTYVGPDGRTIDLTTGLAYTAKADRARRNPRVGLLLEGTKESPIGSADYPVVLLSAMAAVRDADIQANTDRYVRESMKRLGHIMYVGVPWASVRRAVHYMARVWVQCTPVRVLWWPRGRTTDDPPLKWEAPAGPAFPQSDPEPPGRNPATKWPPVDWRERAMLVLSQIPSPHLTVVDDQGFPLPFRTKGATLAADGFELELPTAIPWSPQGPACLTFDGMATFVGEVRAAGSGAFFAVERTLGDLPHAPGGGEIAWFVSPANRKVLMRRLSLELARRGQPIPRVRRFARRPASQC